MNKKISLKSIINIISEEKCMSKEMIFNFVKEAILNVARKKYKILDIDVHITDTSYYKIYAIYNVTKDNVKLLSIADSFKNIPLSYVKKYYTNIKPGDKVKKEIALSKFGRMDIRFIKTSLLNKVKEEEENMLFSSFKDKLRKVVSGIIKYINRDFVVISIGSRVRCILMRHDALFKDFFRKNNRIRIFLEEVVYKNSYPEIKASRRCDSMLLELFRLEVPEIKQGLIEIKGVAREPGNFSKVAIKSNDIKLDPIGTCLGIGGSRLQNISKELCGEKIELVVWDKEIIKYIINIFSDIEIKYIEMNDEKYSMTIHFNKNDYLRIFNKNPCIVKFAEKLTGWNLNILLRDD